MDKSRPFLLKYGLFSGISDQLSETITMSIEKLKPTKEQGKSAPTQTVPTPPAQRVTPPLFRRIDWLTFGVTTLLVFIGYYLTLAPDLTLEDSADLAVGSYTAGVPNPRGYPVCT